MGSPVELDLWEERQQACVGRAAVGLDVLRRDRFGDLRQIGNGHEGRIYRAFDRLTDREVALKLSRTNVRDTTWPMPILTERWRGHPNVVEVYDCFVRGTRPVMVMELVAPACDILTAVRGSTGARRPLPRERWGTLLASFCQLLNAMAALHESGLVHRDIKPGNVLVEAHGRVVLVDLDYLESVSGPHAETPRFTGTAAYAAPEALWGRPASPAADVYSAGVVLFEMLTGMLPTDAPGQWNEGVAPRPAAVADVPAVLDEITREMLRLDPKRRPGARCLASLFRKPALLPGFRPGSQKEHQIAPDPWGATRALG